MYTGSLSWSQARSCWFSRVPRREGSARFAARKSEMRFMMFERVGGETEKEREKKRNREGEREREVLLTIKK